LCVEELWLTLFSFVHSWGPSAKKGFLLSGTFRKKVRQVDAVK
jgi:hypothetical protein